MNDKELLEKDIFSKVLRAGRRTYFFDVRATKADDYYITITESKKFTEEDGSFHFKKHKIYLYKEDFAAFQEILEDMTSYVLNHKGEEVISERHQKDLATGDPTRAGFLSRYLLWGESTSLMENLRRYRNRFNL